MRFLRFLSLLLFILLLPACRREQPSPTITPPAATLTATAGAPPPTTTPSPTPIPTATLEPQPLIRAGAQEVGDDGRIVIASVFAPAGGWLALHAGSSSDGPVLASKLLTAGSSNAVTLTIDPLTAPEEITAALYADAEPLGSFDLQTDPPLTYQGEIVSNLFAVTVTATLPGIVVSDQRVAADGWVRIDEVTAAAPGFVAVYGVNEQMLGFAPVPAGRQQDIAVRIDWRQAVPDLLVTLHEDAGTLTRFQSDDPPVLVSGQPVSAGFRVELPLDVYVFDQPVINDQIVIERVVSNGPGWAVVYTNVADQPGNIIGFAPLADGLNQRVAVSIPANAVTAILYIRLHADTEQPGTFDFPAADPAVAEVDGHLPLFSFRVDQGNYLLTQDQVVTETVIVPMVATNVATWLVVQAEADGQPGEIIGQVHLPAGMAWDVIVPVDAARVTPTLYAALYLDEDPPQVFDYPDGDDTPLTYDGRPILAPFTAQ